MPNKPQVTPPTSTELTLPQKLYAHWVVNWRHTLHTSLSLILIGSGLLSLYSSTSAVFFVYPNLPEYFRQLHYTPEIYAQLLQKAILVSGVGFVESTYGILMLLKPTHTVKNVQVVIALAILTFSVYLRTTGAIIDPELVNQAAQLAKRYP